MNTARFSKLLLALFLTAGLLAGCSRDPNVRKQKYFESGKRYFEKEKYREAAIQYLNAVQVDPKFAEAHYELAQCYLRLGVFQSAFESLLRAVDSNPDLLKAHVDIGNLMLAARKFEDANAKAKLVLEKDPNNVDAHILLANSLAILENVEASIKEMQKAIELGPDRPKSYLNLAYLQIGASQAQQAEQSFRKAIELDPKSTGAHLALGNFLQQTQRWADAEAEYSAAAKIDPASHLPVAALARLALAQGDFSKAEQILLQARPAMSKNPEGYRLLGDFYFSVGKLEQAVTEFASLYEQHPDDLRVKKNYIQLLIVQNRVEEAAKLNDEILKANSRDVEALIHRGQILNRQGKPNDAIQVLEAALKGDAHSPVAHYHLGVAYSAIGDLGRAETEWREAVRLQPQMPAAHQALSTVAIRKGDYNLLRESANQLINSNPASPAGYILLGSERLARNDRPGAEAAFKKAMEVAPTHPSGYVAMGGYYVATKNLTQAERLFNQALDRDPRSTEAISGMAGTFLLQKQPAKAIARVEEQITRVPDVSNFHSLLGDLLFQSQQLDKAEAAYLRASQLDANNVNALVQLARVQEARGDLDAAVLSYERNIQANPRDVRSYILLGALEESPKRRNFTKAQQLYERALRVSPDNALVANNLAYLLLENNGNLDVALTMAQTARRGLPNSPNAADTLAWAYYHKGAYSLAIGLLQGAIKDVPENPTYHYHLGLAYRKNNQLARARDHLRRALELQKDEQKAEPIRRALTELGG